jgi:hypothetical protein
MSGQIGIPCVGSGSEILPRSYLRGVSNLAVPPRIPSGQPDPTDSLEVTFAHEMIDTSNDFMLIEEYEIMLVTDRINEKNRRMFFENIAYVSFIDVILMFVSRLKKQDFV